MRSLRELRPRSRGERLVPFGRLIMVRRPIVIQLVLATAPLTLPAFAQAPDIPADYQQALSSGQRTGKAQQHRVSMMRHAVRTLAGG